MESVLKLIFLFLTLFFGSLLILKYYTLFKGKKLIGKRVNFINEGIIYFYSPKCGACKAMEKHLKSLPEDIKVRKINVFDEENADIIKEFNILATPTTFIVKGGKISNVFVGIVNVENIKKEVMQ